MHVPLILIHWCVGFVVEGGLQRRVFAAPSWEIPTPNVRWIEVSKQVVKGVSKGFVTGSTGVSSFKRMLLDYSWSCAGMRALVVPCVILTRRSATFTTWIMSLCPGLINPLQLKFYNLSRQFQIYCYYDNIIYIYSINHIYIYYKCIYYKSIVYIYCILYMYYRCIFYIYICIC